MKHLNKLYIYLWIFLVWIILFLTLFIRSHKNSYYTNIWFTNFDTDLLNFVQDTQWDNNFMVSPISFKATLAMLTMWANWDTQKKLLKSMWYDDLQNYENWLSDIKSITETKNNYFKEADKENEEYNKKIQEQENRKKNKSNSTWAWGNRDPYMFTMPPSKTAWNSFSILNSIRHNSDKIWTFTENYKKSIKDWWRFFFDVPWNELDTQINNRVNENTKWQIPSIYSQKKTDIDVILVNTVYLKSSRRSSFDKHSTRPWNFTTIDWKTVKKDMMHDSGKYWYYEDNTCQILQIWLQWWFSVAFVLWNNSNIMKKINNTRSQDVIVTLPKFEIDTNLDQKELIQYLKNKWLENIFNQNIWWDFSNMMEYWKLHISDIIQKTKLKIDEDGLEASAATSFDGVMMGIEKRPKYKIFTADKPFSFYIYTNKEEDIEPQLLFYGQYVK